MGNCFARKRGEIDSDSKLNFSGGNVHCVSNSKKWNERISEAKKDGKIVVANFSASWCSPCRIISPFYADISLKFPQLLFLTVDVDDLMALSSSMDVHATPTFFFLQDGRLIDKLVGANKPELEKKIFALAESSHSRQ